MRPKTAAHCKFNMMKCIEILEKQHSFDRKILWNYEQFAECRKLFLQNLLHNVMNVYKKHTARIKK